MLIVETFLISKKSLIDIAHVNQVDQSKMS